ncbi:AGAP007190-PA-like protein [Anopheles sinensis]|uniref:AGAP007190-PA-like protein n=1 Tax=Anopheles sinensis TaxID=74873 RepID=A0A084VC65_ANOSI|nr:AGAP007190-PA-like protein [Anopheles sinensis]
MKFAFTFVVLALFAFTSIQARPQEDTAAREATYEGDKVASADYEAQAKILAKIGLNLETLKEIESALGERKFPWAEIIRLIEVLTPIVVAIVG